MTDVRRVLGLDPGVKSLGWALIEENNKNEAVKLVDAGSIIFNPVFEPQHFKLKNQNRTEKRQTRRQRDRNKRRLSKVENFLIKNSLLSKSLDNFKEFGGSVQAELGNPYYLRSEALNRYIDADQLSFIILHLFRRRGFYSSLKSKTAEEKKKDAVEQGLMQRVRESGCITIGQYFWKEIQKENSTRVRGGDKYNSILEGEKLLRDNLCDELEMIIEKQIEFGHTLLNLTDNDTGVVIKDELVRLFKSQRPLKPQKRRAFCALERKIATFKKIKKNKEVEIKVREIGDKTAHKFHVFSQEFIIRQNINNLKVEDVNLLTGEVVNVTITKEDREFFFNKAWNSTSGVTFKTIRNRLDVSDEANINLEFGNKKGIDGNQLLKLFSGSLNKWFKNLSMENQSLLMNDIHTIKGGEFLGLRTRLNNHWGLNDEQCDLLIQKLEKELKPQYISVCKKAAEKILVELRKGFIFSDACNIVYSNKIDNNFEPKNVLNKLPPFPHTMNPIVNKSGNEVRKLVNRLINQYGKIDVIRLELARDLGLSSKGLAELRNKQNQQEKINKDAKEALEEKNIATTKTNIEKYKLWKETNQKTLFPEKVNGRWVYRNISFGDLFGSTGKFEVEHLLPQAESGDDSFMNKSLCPAGVNQAKGKRTPFDYYFSIMDEQELKNWKKHIHDVLGDNPKKKRFFMTRSQMEKMISSKSSLNDTRYIARELSQYLGAVADRVETIKGGHTAMMRKELDLNILLGFQGHKSRLDLRHHMVDGLVIALTNLSNVDALTKINRIPNHHKFGKNKSKQYLDLTDKINNRYSKIRSDFEDKFNSVFVEHEVEDRPSGCFDEDTIYTLMHLEEVVSECGTYTYAKVSKLSNKGIPKPEVAEDLNNKIYKECKFITSKSATDILNGKTVKQILDMVYGLKLILPKEVICVLENMERKIKIEKTFVLESGNSLKKVKLVYAKPNGNNVHVVKNKEDEVIGFKMLGSNFCVVGYNTGKPRVVSLFEYLKNSKSYKDDVIFKGSILEDNDGNRWKVYKFSGNEICCHPVNFIKIEKRDCLKYNLNISQFNNLQKSFSFYKKNNFSTLI